MLWICIVTKDHPRAFDPAKGPALPTQDYHVGEVFKAYEGKADEMPQAGNLGNLFYRWVGFTDMRLSDLQAVDEFPRVLNDHKPSIRSAADFAEDVKPCAKRSLLDKILRRKKWL